MNDTAPHPRQENHVPDRIASEIHDMAGVDSVGTIHGNRFTIYCTGTISITVPQLHEAGLEEPSIENIVSVGDETNITVSFESFWL